MKLTALFEAEHKNLMLDVNFSSPFKSHQYIISDVSTISHKQFQKLYRISFDSDGRRAPHGYFRHSTPNYPSERDFVKINFNSTGEPQSLPNVVIKTLKWKEFVTTIKAAYPYESANDDFSE